VNRQKQPKCEMTSHAVLILRSDDLLDHAPIILGGMVLR
jgi:hypothetical protein